MKTYEIRTSKITYDFYEVKANSLKEAEERALCRDDKVSTLITVAHQTIARRYLNEDTNLDSLHCSNSLLSLSDIWSCRY